MNTQVEFERLCRDEVAIKTPAGRTYQEIEEAIAAPLPAEFHELKKLGYSKDLGCDTYWGFVPYWRLRQHLKELVGSQGFRFELTSTYVSSEGVPVFVGILNVLGVEKQGIGFGLSHDSYKGNRDEIAKADCFKNAAEEHGLGAYLDDQVGLVRYLVKSKSTSAIANGRKLAIQFQRANRLTLQELRAWDANNTDLLSAPSAPVSKPAPTPAPAPQTPDATSQRPQLYPQHNAHIRELRLSLGRSSEYILELTGGISPSRLPFEQFEELLRVIAVEWAVKEQKFKDIAIAKTALQGSLSQSTKQGRSVLVGVHLWLKSLGANLILEAGLTPIE